MNLSTDALVKVDSSTEALAKVDSSTEALAKVDYEGDMRSRLMHRILSLSIRAHFFLMALTVAVPSAGIIIYSGLNLRQNAIEAAIEEIKHIGDDIADQQQHAVDSAEQLMSALAQLREIRGHDAERTREILGEIVKLNPLYLNMSVADPSGTVWASALGTKAVSLADRRYFINGMATGRLSSGEYTICKNLKKPTINLCYPYKDENGAILGAITLAFDLDRLGPAGTAAEYQKYGYVLFDHRGVLLSRSNRPESAIGRMDRPESFHRMRGPEGSFIGAGLDGRERFITYRKLYLKGEKTPYMYIRTGVPVQTVVEQANALLMHNLLLFASSLAGAFLIAWFIGKRSIIDRVSLLQTASRRLADGDLRVRVSDTITGGELGELGCAFDDMARQLDARERDHYEAEHALRRSESRYRSLFENSLFGIIMMGPDNKLMQANEAFCKLLGYREEELVGVRTLADVTHPEDVAASLEKYQGLLHREFDRYLIEKRYLSKTGDVVRVIAVVQGIFSDEGRHEGGIACILDVTEVKASEERMRLYFERQIVGMAITTPDNKWLRTNAKLQQMLGYSGEELSRTSWTKVTHPEDLRRNVAQFNRMLSGEIDEFAIEKRFIRKDGSQLDACVSVCCVRRDDGQVDYVLALYEDITERKRAEDEILLLQSSLEQRVLERTAQLEAAISEQESFSYSVSHDLRSPLRHINSYLTILQEEYGGCFPQESRHYLERACAASVTMGKLIDDLLELSRVSRSKLVKESVNLSQVAASIVNMLQETEPYRVVKVEIAPDLRAMGDQVLMGQVLENLLGNAWKYTSRKQCARLVFGAEVIDEERIFFVRDNGAGFDMAYQDKLFGAFQRLHGDEYEGTGIGLATVKRILERHGGAVWAQSEVGAGATFYFSVPD